jgi:hypothetical protein
VACSFSSSKPKDLTHALSESYRRAIHGVLQVENQSKNRHKHVMNSHSDPLSLVKFFLFKVRDM